VSGGDGTGDGCGLVLVVYALAGEESGTTLRGLEDDGALLVAGSLERCDYGGAGGDVDGGNGIALLLCVLEELEDIVTDDDTGLAGENAGRVRRVSIAVLARCALRRGGRRPMQRLPLCLPRR
jgi:hypothetical protein